MRQSKWFSIGRQIMEVDWVFIPPLLMAIGAVFFGGVGYGIYRLVKWRMKGK